MATICYNQGMKEDVVKLRHERSLKDYPGLALEDDEYVELEINRSKAGLVLIWGIVILLSLIMAVSIVVLTLSGDFLGLNDTAHSYLLMLLIILFVIFIVAGLVLSYVYKGNRRREMQVCLHTCRCGLSVAKVCKNLIRAKQKRLN